MGSNSYLNNLLLLGRLDEKFTGNFKGSLDKNLSETYNKSLINDVFKKSRFYAHFPHCHKISAPKIYICMKLSHRHFSLKIDSFCKNQWNQNTHTAPIMYQKFNWCFSIFKLIKTNQRQLNFTSFTYLLLQGELFPPNFHTNTFIGSKKFLVQSIFFVIIYLYR